VKLRALLLCAGLLAPVGCTATTSVSNGTLPFKVAVIPFDAAALPDLASEGSAPEGNSIVPRFDSTQLIGAVRDALAAGAALAAPYWRAKRGHPVGFAGDFRAELEALSGDEGARRLVDAHAAREVKVPVGDPGAIRDIDRPSDLAPPVAV